MILVNADHAVTIIRPAITGGQQAELQTHQPVLRQHSLTP